ncbi:xylulokinase [Paenibacillus guangzhouensis]|uniref:xylulokinase n=1 Tax=Paenibacillus guangzhouensis TaxID=1473112 RepID=UPI001266FFE7|nr:FGGY family carbohydrate kinase [Paenibacillus guangzhouensis]
MGYIAAFDIGTTNAKGVLVNKQGELHQEQDVPMQTLLDGGWIEQHPAQWMDAVCTIANAWWSSGIRADDIELITFSGQMQDIIPIRADGSPVRPAILYSDGRAAHQAERMNQELSPEGIFQVTGNALDGTSPLAKLLWIKEQEAEQDDQTAWYLISSKDYVIYHLTGQAVTDATSAATAGMMNLHTRTWESAWLSRFGLNSEKLTPILAPDAVAGEVHSEAARITGFRAGTTVLCGIGDAGATTIGAGVTAAGEMYGYVGTTGWIGMTSHQKLPAESRVFHLAHAAEGVLIAVAPMLNAGNAHQWAVATFGEGAVSSQQAYQAFEEAVRTTDRLANPLLFLPYLNGERSPIQDQQASGCFIGLRQATTKAMMGCAVLEGVAFAMKHVQQQLGGSALQKPLVLIGGGTKSQVWCQIIADVFGVPVRVPQDSQYLPALGAASGGFIQLGWVNSYTAFAEQYLSTAAAEVYMPDDALHAHYQRKFEQYKNIYPSVKDLFITY